jgi:hypothetical protein
MSVVMSDNVSIDPDPTLSAIRSILDAPASFNAAPNLQDQTQKAVAASLHAETARKVKDQKAAMVLDEEKIQPQKKIASPSDSELIKAKPNKQSLFGKLRLQFQPRRKHVVWAGFACAIVLRPNWFLLTFMLPIIVFLGAFAVFGANKSWGCIMWIFSVFAGRSPQRANRFARRMDKVAVLWDGILDRFPEGMVDGLYLPDFQSILAAEERHDAVVDARLSRMHAEG